MDSDLGAEAETISPIGPPGRRVKRADQTMSCRTDKLRLQTRGSHVRRFYTAICACCHRIRLGPTKVTNESMSSVGAGPRGLELTSTTHPARLWHPPSLVCALPDGTRLDGRDSLQGGLLGPVPRVQAVSRPAHEPARVVRTGPELSNRPFRGRAPFLSIVLTNGPSIPCADCLRTRMRPSWC